VIEYLTADNLIQFVIWYFIIFIVTLFLNAFIAGLCKQRLTFRDYVDSLLFPVTYLYLIGVTISGIYHSIKFRLQYTKSQIKNIKEKEALKKLDKQR
jgi:hypothetical protein